VNSVLPTCSQSFNAKRIKFPLFSSNIVSYAHSRHRRRFSLHFLRVQREVLLKAFPAGNYEIRRNPVIQPSPPQVAHATSSLFSPSLVPGFTHLLFWGSGILFSFFPYHFLGIVANGHSNIISQLFPLFQAWYPPPPLLSFPNVD